tara:strand:+ start:295 stop:1488 length:1194 start_codon:yes stop_codon:yes gene_type:complete
MKIQEPFTLPCGAIIPNRMAKSAMSENMATKNHQPNPAISQLYKTWADGGIGLSITGNVMVDRKHLNGEFNIVLDEQSDKQLLKKWAACTQGTNQHLWVQINHPGRQPIPFSKQQPVAPSAVRVKIMNESVFQTPKPLTEREIEDIIERFGNAASISKEAGFTGVQIHAAHGYLISQFLSPLSNLREDKWGGSLENRARFLLAIYKNMRAKVGDKFPIGVKLNSADFQKGGITEEESMQVIDMLSAIGIDLIEVSGGTYERPKMMGSKIKDSTKKREAYFIDFIRKVRKQTNVPLMLTGGVRNVDFMEECLATNQLDFIGIARPFALLPNLVQKIFNRELKSLKHLESKFSGTLDLIVHEKYLKDIGAGKNPKVLEGLSAKIFFIKNFFLMLKGGNK